MCIHNSEVCATLLQTSTREWFRVLFSQKVVWIVSGKIDHNRVSYAKQHPHTLPPVSCIVRRVPCNTTIPVRGTFRGECPCRRCSWPFRTIHKLRPFIMLTELQLVKHKCPLRPRTRWPLPRVRSYPRRYCNKARRHRHHTNSSSRRVHTVPRMVICQHIVRDSFSRLVTCTIQCIRIIMVICRHSITTTTTIRITNTRNKFTNMQQQQRCSRRSPCAPSSVITSRTVWAQPYRRLNRPPTVRLAMPQCRSARCQQWAWMLVWFQWEGTAGAVLDTRRRVAVVDQMDLARLDAVCRWPRTKTTSARPQPEPVY